ncbi:LTA synthase family protein [Acetobacteraceae bacterium H6797]|nr:LTA synthase family protein [Acetobacteraceae bacterium H6797]
MTIALGCLLPLFAWAATRWAARAFGGRALWLDLLAPTALMALLLGLTDRPLFSGLLVAAPLIGIAVADLTKRAVLGEPVVFADAALLPLVLRHPGLYLPFAGTGRVLAALGLGALLLLAFALLEPGAGLGWWRWALIAAGLLALAGPLRVPPCGLRGAIAREAAADSARFGLLATLALHRRVAREEREARRAAFPAEPPAFTPAPPLPHVVLIQAESFWDPRRDLPDAPALPHWDRLQREAVAHGRLAVPGFGANTMRAEAAVLTGIDEPALGLDRFNPFFRFLAPGLRSLPRSLAAAGYRALAVHPFDAGFFGRDKVFPAIGFTRFDALESFAEAPRRGAHVADAALGEKVLAMLAEAPTPGFVFAITMQAHGPWHGADPLAEWAGHIRDTDAMLGALAEAASVLDRPLLIAVYGDHLPALPQTARLADQRTDWLLWRSDRPGQGAMRDIAAHELFHLIGEALGSGGEARQADRSS